MSEFDDLEERMRYQLADSENFVLVPSETKAVLDLLRESKDLRASLAERERATEAALAEAERQRDDMTTERDNYMRWYYATVEERDAAEAALADTREALRNLLAWADETVEAIAQDYGAVGADETAPLEAARAVLAAVPPQQGAPADTDARPANNAGTRGEGTQR